VSGLLLVSSFPSSDCEGGGNINGTHLLRLGRLLYGVLDGIVGVFGRRVRYLGRLIEVDIP
jgi:hypothetical protein